MALRIYCEYNRTGENLRLRFSSITRAYHFSIQKRHKKIHGTAFFVFTFEIYIPIGFKTAADRNNTQWAIELSYHYREEKNPKTCYFRVTYAMVFVSKWKAILLLLLPLL